MDGLSQVPLFLKDIRSILLDAFLVKSIGARVLLTTSSNLKGNIPSDVHCTWISIFVFDPHAMSIEPDFSQHGSGGQFGRASDT